jgi:4-amino-4-deoxy-L-arabinose transferase-like glycosyltransferase
MSGRTRWLRRNRDMLALSALMFCSALVLRAYTYTTAGLDWDESLYIVMAQNWLRGNLPYVAVWDQHPVGLPALFVAAQWLVGDGLLAVRITALIAVVGTAILLACLLNRFVNERLAGALAGLLYLFYMSRPEGLAGNTEVFNNFIVTAASFLLLEEMVRPMAAVRARMVFAAALLFGVGLQIKYVVIPESVFLCCAFLFHFWRQGARLERLLRLAVVAMAGGLLPTGIMTLYFWSVGALTPYLDANLSANIRYLGDQPSLALTLMRLRFGLLPLFGLLPWPVVLAWLWRNRGERARLGVLGGWLTVWLIAAAVDVALPLKLWKHYFNALIPPLCLIGGLALVLLVRRTGWWRWRLLVPLVVLTLLPAVGSMIKHAADSRTFDRINVPRALADQIRQGGSDGQDIYIFNYDSLVYAYANAVPPTRYVLGIELADFSDVSGTRSPDEIGRILSGRPRWIVVADPSPYIYPASVWREIDDALRNYRVAGEWREVDYIQPPIMVRLYRLNDEAASDVSRLPHFHTVSIARANTGLSRLYQSPERLTLR